MRIAPTSRTSNTNELRSDWSRAEEDDVESIRPVGKGHRRDEEAVADVEVAEHGRQSSRRRPIEPAAHRRRAPQRAQHAGVAEIEDRHGLKADVDDPTGVRRSAG